MEDHDDLMPVFAAQSDLLSATYGEFFLADMIELQDNENKVRTYLSHLHFPLQKPSATRAEATRQRAEIDRVLAEVLVQTLLSPSCSELTPPDNREVMLTKQVSSRPDPRTTRGGHHRHVCGDEAETEDTSAME